MKMINMKSRVCIFLTAFLFCLPAQSSECLYVSSYHPGYEWNDGIELGIEKVLNGKCKLDKFYMDTKRNKSVTFAKEMAVKAKDYIERTQPDVIMACDDNASKYLVKPYYKNGERPFVFCGINWTTKEYGYPYDNVTGMIEVAPIMPLLKVIQQSLDNPTEGVYLSADVLTEHKDFQRYKDQYEKNNIKLKGMFAKTMEEWKAAFLQAQSSDFVILNNNSGINDWNKREALEHVNKHSKTFTVTNYIWMMSYSMLAMTKLPEEQGEWAGQVALAILDGDSPKDIPVVVNRRWKIYLNPLLLTMSPAKIPHHIVHKAIHLGLDN